MPEPTQAESSDGFLNHIPEPQEVRRRIAENIRQRQFLRQVLKLAEQRQSIAVNPRGCQEGDSDDR